MTRRVVRGSKFRVNQRVVVDGDCNGNYCGTVVKTHDRLRKTRSTFDNRLVAAPGITVLVDEWEGVKYDYNSGLGFLPFEIVAHDTDVLTSIMVERKARVHY